MTTSGSKPIGIFKKSNTGLRIFDKISVAPLDVNMLTPIISRHKFGIRAKDERMPSIAPLVKAPWPSLLLNIRIEKASIISGIVNEEI